MTDPVKNYLNNVFLDFETFGKPANYDYVNRLLNIFSIVHFIYHFCCVFLISSSKVFLAETCQEQNLRLGINEVCGMVGRMWLPFNYDFFPLKQIICAYEVGMCSFKSSNLFIYKYINR